MKEENIYLVVASFGSNDDFRTKNLRAFKNIEDAKSYKEKANFVLKKVSEHVTNDREYEELSLLYGEAFMEKYRQISNEKETILAEEREFIHRQFTNFNHCEIEIIKFK